MKKWGACCERCGHVYLASTWPNLFLCDYCISGQVDEIIWEAA